MSDGAMIRYAELVPKVFPANRETRVVAGPGALPSALFTMGYVVMQPGGEVPGHTHPQEEVYFLLEGDGRITVGEMVFQMEPLSAVYIPPDTFHHLTNVGPGELRFVFTYAPGGEVEHWAQELAHHDAAHSNAATEGSS